MALKILKVISLLLIISVISILLIVKLFSLYFYSRGLEQYDLSIKENRLFWKLKPNQARWRKGLLFGSFFRSSYFYRINKYGFRGEDYPLLDKNIILFLGDSMTYGEGVSNGFTFSDIVNEYLEEKRGDLLVVNAGVMGYGTIEERMLLETLTNLKLKKVFLFFIENDFFPPPPLANLKPWELYILSWSKIYLFFRIIAYTIKPWDLEPTEQDWLKLENELLKIEDICCKKGADFYVVSIATMKDEMKAHIMDILEANQIRFFDLESRWEGNYEDLQLPCHHLNEFGHLFIALHLVKIINSIDK